MHAFPPGFTTNNRTLYDGVAALQHDLVMSTKEWEDLVFKERCPMAPPDAENSSAHESDYRYFVTTRKLRKHVADYLTIPSNGWVHKEVWNAIQLRHRELYDDAVLFILSAENSDNDEPVKSEEDLKAIWPFDL